jgi:anti-sigma B factor antagonist
VQQQLFVNNGDGTRCEVSRPFCFVNSGVGVTAQDTQAGSLLTIGVTRIEARALVSLSGRLTIDSSPELRNQLLAMLYGRKLENLVIDLSDVSYVDVSGVATFLETLKVARARKTGLQLKGLHDRPLYLLEVTGLLSLFETVA